jgi:hypothetical protein
MTGKCALIEHKIIQRRSQRATHSVDITNDSSDARETGATARDDANVLMRILRSLALTIGQIV